MNEFAAVALRKLGLPLRDIREILDAVRTLCAVEPLTAATHALAIEKCERY